MLDPSRAPAGAATLWLQLQELPGRPVGDSAGLLDVGSGEWTPTLAAAYAERVLDRLAAHAPGLRGLVVGTDVISPADLTAHNANAIGGDPYAGSAELDQNFAWRPLPSSGRHRTPVPGLWHLGASTHPGPGLGGASGTSWPGLCCADGERRTGPGCRGSALPSGHRSGTAERRRAPAARAARRE